MSYNNTERMEDDQNYFASQLVLLRVTGGSALLWESLAKDFSVVYEQRGDFARCLKFISVLQHRLLTVLYLVNSKLAKILSLVIIIFTVIY